MQAGGRQAKSSRDAQRVMRAVGGSGNVKVFRRESRSALDTRVITRDKRNKSRRINKP